MRTKIELNQHLPEEMSLKLKTILPLLSPEQDPTQTQTVLEMKEMKEVKEVKAILLQDLIRQAPIAQAIPDLQIVMEEDPLVVEEEDN